VSRGVRRRPRRQPPNASLTSSEEVAFGMATPTTSSACSARSCTTMAGSTRKTAVSADGARAEAGREDAQRAVDHALLDGVMDGDRAARTIWMQLVDLDEHRIGNQEVASEPGHHCRGQAVGVVTPVGGREVVWNRRATSRVSHNVSMRARSRSRRRSPKCAR
jgi:hypothetical protein